MPSTQFHRWGYPPLLFKVTPNQCRWDQYSSIFFKPQKLSWDVPGPGPPENRLAYIAIFQPGDAGPLLQQHLPEEEAALLGHPGQGRERHDGEGPWVSCTWAGRPSTACWLLEHVLVKPWVERRRSWSSWPSTGASHRCYCRANALRQLQQVMSNFVVHPFVWLPSRMILCLTLRTSQGIHTTPIDSLPPQYTYKYWGANGV